MSEAENQLINQAGNKEALQLWHKVVLENVRHNDFNLSERQLAILLTVYTQDLQHTVKSLSESLQITKPPVCRALDALSKHKLIERITDKKDRRNIFVGKTETGADFLTKFSGNIMSVLMEM